MTEPPDQLPRSASGRVPQWVVDEAAGRPTAPTAWRAVPTVVDRAPARGRRRGPWVGAAALAVVVLGGAWWLTAGMSGMPTGVPTTGPVAEAPPTPTVPAPSAEVVALADEAFLSEEGRSVLFATRVEVLDAVQFAGRCTRGVAAPPVPSDGAVGCYVPAENSVVVYAPADPRARGSVVNTFAHEVLHVAWTHLTPDERAALTPLLEAEISTVPGDDRIHEQIDGSVGDHPETRPTELFAYLGAQVWRDGGLAPELESVYARFITDRAALVGVHTGFLAQLDQLAADIQAAYQAVAATEGTNAQARAQYDADVSAVEHYRGQYQAQLAGVEAMPAEQRERLRLSWVWWDGTELPMAPADETLATAAALLARDDAALPVREVQLRAAEDAARTERERVDALAEDLRGLHAQLDPSGGAA